MPADSDPTVPGLPARWRPFGTRVAGWFFGSLFVFLCGFMWFALGDLRSRFPEREVWSSVGLGLLVLLGLHAMMRSRVDATERGLTVVNGFRRRRFEWAGVVHVSLPPGAPWAVLDLADGTTVPAMGIQGSDGARAQQSVRELRTLIETFQPRGH